MPANSFIPVRTTRPNQGCQWILKLRKEDLGLRVFLCLRLVVGLGEFAENLVLGVSQDGQRVLHGVVDNVLNLEFVLVIGMRIG